jgi:tRNA A-37 threonylcarbamoyl transferase component Bud32
MTGRKRWAEAKGVVVAESKLDEVSIFNAACQIANSAERHQYVRDVCGEDIALASRVLVLLRALDEHPTFLASPTKELGGLLASINQAADTLAHLPALNEGSPAPPPALAGYEILGELGRGAMGVVYKARQTALNRTVALKMILSGAHAGPLTQARFTLEAEAIAAIRHPHVVEVFDFGRADGLPYFALEFVDGGTLAERLAKTGPLSPTAAAEMVAKLATGMAAAHAKGIIHRDLKPANVLLTADGEPKVTDFGLARIGESEMTATGAVMGTPSYMSPEQAGGHTREVGTHSDVWALGAILYELLTGRPPFRGDSIQGTLQQVLTRDPEQPRTINPSVSRDLELICLKCLAKEPQHRYGSAEALAADLGHWLSGEPVSVRPPTLTALLRLWLRQNFGAAGWTLVIGLVVGVLVSGVTWLAVIEPALSAPAAAYQWLPSVKRPLLAFSWQPPAWQRNLVPLIGLAALASLGLMTARLVRPRNRSADIAAGLATGLVTGTVLFTLSFGWLAVVARSQPTTQDIMMLCRAALADPPPLDAASDPRARLLTRYPDLPNVPAERRAGVVYGDVLCRLLAGIPIAIWFGMLLALGVSVAAAVSGACVAGPLLRNGGLRWKIVPPYLEAELPVAGLMVAIFMLLGIPMLDFRLSMQAWHLALLFILPALVLVGVQWRWHWALRVLLHVAWVSALILS